MFGLFPSYCILYVLDHILSYCIRFLDLENVCLDTKIMWLWCSEAEILTHFRKKQSPFLKSKMAAIGCLEKCKHCFSDLVGPNVSKNVYFSKSPKIMNENTQGTGLMWQTDGRTDRQRQRTRSRELDKQRDEHSFHLRASPSCQGGTKHYQTSWVNLTHYGP